MKKKSKATEAAQTNSKGVNKDTHFSSQYQVVYTSFMQQPKTMLDVFLQTGILRANVCRYVAIMKKEGVIQLIRKDKDRSTGYMAGYYSTDKKLFLNSSNKQFDLFEEVLK